MADKRVVVLAAIAVALALVLVFWKPRCWSGAEGFMTGAPAHAKDLVIRDANDKIVFNNAKNAATAKVVTIPVKCIVDGTSVFPYDDDVVSQKAIEEHEKKIKTLKLELKDNEDQLAKKKAGMKMSPGAKTAAKATAKAAKATAKAATQTAAKAANKAAAKSTVKPGSKDAKAAAKIAATASKTAAKAATTATKAKTVAKAVAKKK